ncbi:hypothetical protein BGX34_004197 [Mortierella sp. NVP85]|nr:hypothetical protein BGX34_004197 [Mortierella sp. NVP85]
MLFRLQGHQVEEAWVLKELFEIRASAIPSPDEKLVSHLVLDLKGPSGQDLLLQAMQLILRKQLFALIHDFGFPSELEEVAREYWILYVSLINTYQDKPVSNPDMTDNQNSSMNGDDDQGPRQSGPASEEDHSMFKDKATIEESDTDGVEAIGGHKGYDTDHSEPSSENLEEDEEDEDDDDDDDVASLHGDHSKNGTDAVGANKEDEPEREHGGESKGESEGESDVGGTHAPTSSRKKGVRGKPRAMLSTLYAVLDIEWANNSGTDSLHSLSSRWALQRKIPYYGAFFDLPAKMTRRISYGFKSHLHPMAKEPSKFHTAAANLDLLLRRSFGVHSNLPNIPALTLRFVQELMLPGKDYQGVCMVIMSC